MGGIDFEIDPKESGDADIEPLLPPRNSKCFPVRRDFPDGCVKQNSGYVYSMSVGSKKLLVTEKGKHGDKECERVVVSREIVNVPSKDPASRKKVIKALDRFYSLLAKLSEEQGQKIKLLDGATLHLHIRAAMTLKMQHKSVNSCKRLGPVSGVEVGDRFQWRAELYVIGLHLQFNSGIDYMNKDGKILASSIVASARYSNYMESSDFLIYSGQGGNPRVRGGPIMDQKLRGGNLALKNSMEAMAPVRVIRATKIRKPRRKSYSSYFYDGLYFVASFWQERGDFGKLVFKFLLRRTPSFEICTFQKQISCMDGGISQRKEEIQMPTVNLVDDGMPSFSNYAFKDHECDNISMQCESYSNNVTEDHELDNISMQSGCDCTDGCSDSEDCACTLKNGREFPYNYKECVVEAKPCIYECGPSCKCFYSCLNRVSQRGTQFQLEVFETQSKRWGVRSRSYIPRGSFVCEYRRDTFQDKEVKQKIGKDEDFPNVEFSSIVGNVDARKYVGRFINYSSSPNLYAQNVLYDHGDKRMPHIMLFAMMDIPTLQELTCDFNHRLDDLCDGNGNVKL
ncbi:SET domain-containing protein/YDG_SRA domain-containing protein/Pre-SET domain-containing protein [Cephalotus follicularis]|uniref:SET domain-containing protein/YDG_SRA domain-containing protein/Pre-SET domain-containing protein n=1 Tax=Cephalotus follicularis TaxID=3775 RepID=A0A1Q3BZD5_CEPFO|nr:SET domain-containing protein/YDG_SRA domain-containing protein/Pre-SET domain-containing protein [Cephalotus follicularis]